MDKELDINNSIILVTGCAGFIGGALTLKLIESTAAKIIGIDNLNNYYDVKLKEYRIDRIRNKDKDNRFTFIKADISNKQIIFSLFEKYKPHIVVHLAAQAGVRYSIDNPDVYIQSNIIGFYNVVEACRYSIDKEDSPIRHLLYASSSSVYGNNRKIPYSTDDMTDKPVSLYAATKKTDELIAYSYSKLYGIPMTGMRFFTVYGPAGRPDMAYYKFVDRILSGEMIELYNKGINKRDFTYIDDVVNAILELIGCFPVADEEGVFHDVVNIGNNKPIDVLGFVEILENALKSVNILDDSFKISDRIILKDSQPGDVEITYADVNKLHKKIGFSPLTPLNVGLIEFCKWYSDYTL